MSDQYEKTKVLITVMTYPLPSRSYQELVCTAAIAESGEWVRLYPIDYRYRPFKQRFRKYQWIEIELASSGQGNDNRKESRRPNLDSINPLGPPLSTKDSWAARRLIIDAMPHHTVKELRNLYERDRTSLGIVRPEEVVDLVYEPADPEWKPEWQTLFSQLRLFGEPQKPLRKIPYSFRYVFRCADSSSEPHKTLIEDWELGVLWLKEADRLGSDEAAAESVRNKYLNELCRSDKDTRFFMGTTFPWNSWVVLGVFWPPSLPPKQLAIELNTNQLF